MVTSKFTHDAAEALDLNIEGVAGAIGVTPNHPIWSDDRREFVRADELAVGESLLDALGARVAVREVTARSGRTVVFNLEVEGEYSTTCRAPGCWCIIVVPMGLLQGERRTSPVNFL